MDVFLSYAHEDRELAEELADRLAIEGIKVWVADRELYPGDNWPLEVGKALQRSDAMIVMLSPAYVSSPRLQNEYSYALGAANYRQRVIPVIARSGEDVPWMLDRLGVIKADRNRERAFKEVLDRLREGAKAVG